MQRGHTLTELLLTILIAGIVMTLAIPSMGDVLARQRQRAEIDALFHAFHTAKKESVMRQIVVSLCASSDGERCDHSTDWSAGWMMFVNEDRDEPAQRDTGEARLAWRQPADHILIRSNRRSYTLRSTRRRATNGTVVVCDEKQRAEPRAVVVSVLGRPRVTAENRYGSAYSCLN